jgi:hypothetical protein
MPATHDKPGHRQHGQVGRWQQQLLQDCLQQCSSPMVRLRRCALTGRTQPVQHMPQAVTQRDRPTEAKHLASQVR